MNNEINTNDPESLAASDLMRAHKASWMRDLTATADEVRRAGTSGGWSGSSEWISDAGDSVAEVGITEDELPEQYRQNCEFMWSFLSNLAYRLPDEIVRAVAPHYSGDPDDLYHELEKLEPATTLALGRALGLQGRAAPDTQYIASVMSMNA